jgi:hypothetical protein
VLAVGGEEQEEVSRVQEAAKPEATAEAAEAAAAVLGGGGGGAQLPPGWMPKWSASKAKAYYIKGDEGAVLTAWSVAKAWALEGGAAPGAAPPEPPAPAQAAAPPPAEEPPRAALPNGWAEMWSATRQRPYYMNSETGAKAWSLEKVPGYPAASSE